MKVNIILGAGFSIPANYPSGKTLNERFFEKVENRIIKASSGEWFWDEYDKTLSHNCRLNTDYLNLSYLLSELVEQYQIQTSKVFDYEEFYDWFTSHYNKQPFWELCCSKVNTRLIINHRLTDNSSHLFKKVDKNQFLQINEVYNYLIADLLNRPYLRDEKTEDYKNLIQMITDSSAANIFTLNHDTLAEYLLNYNAISFSDGFTKENSPIIGEEGKGLPTFQDKFNSKVNLFKLHGSVDYLQFLECSGKRTTLTYTGNYWFFKTDNYYDKHYAKRIEIETGQVFQSLNPIVTPQFLTGKSKIEVIKDHLVYGPIYKRLKDSFSDVGLLIIIGYSFRDNHINAIIKEALDKNDFKVVNINPSIEFPFRKNYSRDIIKEVKSLSNYYS